MIRKHLGAAATFAFTTLTAVAATELDKQFEQAKSDFERTQSMHGYLMVGGAVLVVIMLVAIVVTNSRRQAKMRSWNFDWYKKEFPNLIKGGRVACYKCNGTDIGIERLMNHMYMRRHVCRTCGTALYYSPEQ